MYYGYRPLFPGINVTGNLISTSKLQIHNTGSIDIPNPWIIDISVIQLYKRYPQAGEPKQNDKFATRK